LCDMVNQEELTPERVKNWVTQLQEEGFLEGGTTGAAVPPTTTAVPAPSAEIGPESVFQTINEHSDILDEAIKAHGSTGYTPHYNSKTKSTMWVSADGRSCFYTAAMQSTYSP
jgi:hypothetical protein